MIRDAPPPAEVSVGIKTEEFAILACGVHVAVGVDLQHHGELADKGLPEGCAFPIVHYQLATTKTSDDP